jgi:radical SAM protein with 4Fe4S-binding SPASM domain
MYNQIKEFKRRFKDKHKYTGFYYYNKFVPRAWIHRLIVEFTSHCNLNCKYCILDDSRPKGFITEERLIRILDEIDNLRYKINEIYTFNGGETLLHPNLEKLFNIIGERKKERKKIPIVSLNTNCTLLTDEKSKIIVNSNALDKIWFSIDGGNKEDYEAIRKTSWESTLEKVNRFLDLNDGQIETAIYCLTPFDKFTLSEEFKTLMGRVDEVRFNKPHTFDGSKDIGIYRPPKTGICDYIYTDLCIFWDGRVSPCCADINGRCIIGDINKQSIYDIYKSKKRQWIIKMLMQNRREEIPLCKNCTL